MNVNSNNSSEIKGHESTVKRFPFKSHKVWKFILCKNIHILDWLHVVYFGEVGERVTMATYRLQYCTNLLHSNIFVKQHEISFFSNYKETYWCSSFRYLQSFTFFFSGLWSSGAVNTCKNKGMTNRYIFIPWSLLCFMLSKMYSGKTVSECNCPGYV